MSMIDYLDENEIRQYSELHSAGGIGCQVEKAMKDYNKRLIHIGNGDFQETDQSSAKAAIVALRAQMNAISSSMEEVDVMIDNLFYMLKTGILDEEDKIASNVPED